MGYILQTDNISKSYRGFKLIDDISISLESGHIYALIGRSGAGKTTLMRILAGFVLPDSGNITLFGESDPKTVNQLRSRIGTLIESPICYDGMTADQNMTVERIINPKADRQTAEAMLQRLDLGKEKVGKSKMRLFSIGMKQRYAVIAALLGNPELLLLDEPAKGLNADNAVIVRQMLVEQNRETGVTVFISDQSLEPLYGIATDYIFMNDGKIVSKITHSELETATGGEPDRLTQYLDRISPPPVFE